VVIVGLSVTMLFIVCSFRMIVDVTIFVLDLCCLNAYSILNDVFLVLLLMSPLFCMLSLSSMINLIGVLLLVSLIVCLSLYVFA
jgi:hypothetical protein